MTITRSDVAQEAGVSPAVVSYVLNNGPRPVAPSTRLRVESAIAKLGYRPNAIASALRGGSTHSIGLLTPNPRDPFHAELAQALEQRFSAQGYLVLTGDTAYDRSREERYLRTFLDRKVDGLILSAGTSLVQSPSVVLGDQPTLVLDDAPDDGRLSSIATEDRLDAATTVEHLQRHGHRLVGCISGPPQVHSEAERTMGWREQQRANGAPAGDELLAYGEISEAGGNAAALLLLSGHGRPWAVHGESPSALFVSSDVQATGALFACYELGLRVPDDVAIVSMGGTQTAAYTIPPLTTLRPDVGYIAQSAVDGLLARIDDSSIPPQRMRLRGNLVVGHSCGC